MSRVSMGMADEMLRSIRLLELVGEGDWSMDDVGPLLPEGTRADSPYLALLAIGGVAVRHLAAGWEMTVPEAMEHLRQRVILDIAEAET